MQAQYAKPAGGRTRGASALEGGFLSQRPIAGKPSRMRLAARIAAVGGLSYLALIASPKPGLLRGASGASVAVAARCAHVAKKAQDNPVANKGYMGHKVALLCASGDSLIASAQRAGTSTEQGQALLRSALDSLDDAGQLLRGIWVDNANVYPSGTASPNPNIGVFKLLADTDGKRAMIFTLLGNSVSSRGSRILQMKSLMLIHMARASDLKLKGNLASAAKEFGAAGDEAINRAEACDSLKSAKHSDLNGSWATYAGALYRPDDGAGACLDAALSYKAQREVLEQSGDTTAAKAAGAKEASARAKSKAAGSK